VAGIYIHIPFCRQKCSYCNFFSLATTKFRNEFLQALLSEIYLTRGYLGDQPIETIYFGGGTPSLLPVSRLEEILQAISHEPRAMRDKDGGSRVEGRGSKVKGRETKSEKRKAKSEKRNVTIVNRRSEMENREITLEMNPDDVTPDYLEALSYSAINRVSLGVQSFLDEDLKYLGRSHDARQAVMAVELIRDTRCGMRVEGRGSRVEDQEEKFGIRNSEFVNLNVDLIYGIPTLMNAHWRENLQRVIDLGIPHISAYALTVEPKTQLAWQIRQNPSPSLSPTGEGRIRYPVSDDQASEQFEILIDEMDKAGYIHYEISNFCLPGYESRHNSNYWLGVPYLGLGPSAHSYNGTSRRWNILNLTSYIHGIQTGHPHTEEEILSISQMYNEYVMTSLRTVWGCDLQEIHQRFGEWHSSYFRDQAIRHLASGHLTGNAGIYTLTRKGKFLADGIAADLFVEE